MEGLFYQRRRAKANLTLPFSHPCLNRQPCISVCFCCQSRWRILFSGAQRPTYEGA